jgi:hypothetical protein
MIIAVIAMAAFATPAAATDGRGAGFSTAPPASSVFPQPRDPWQSWGVRNELPRRVGPPRAHDGVIVSTPARPAPAAVWVPARWVWDGAAWTWWPGAWVR